jgi:hypothetical protein
MKSEWKNQLSEGSPAGYEQLLHLGIRALMKSAGQASIAPQKDVHELLVATLIENWKTFSIQKDSEALDPVALFLAVFNRKCFEKYNKETPFTLGEYPTEQEVSNILGVFQKKLINVPMLKGKAVAAPSLRFFRISTAVLTLSVLILAFFLVQQRWQTESYARQMELDRSRFEALSRDYTKLYSAYYELEGKVEVILNREVRPYKINNESDGIYADVMHFVEDAELLFSADSLPDPGVGFAFELWVKENDITRALGLISSGPRRFDVFPYEQKAANISFFLKKIEITPQSDLPASSEEEQELQ